MNTATKILFFGTPQFAVPALEQLIKSDFDVVGVVTREDKPQGRNKKVLTPPPVKEIAVQHNIPVLQPSKFTDEVLQQIHDTQPDVFVIVAYGKILPQALLDIPPHGSINIHPSLLPLYRGPSPLQAQILDGVSETGVSIMLIDEEMDHGPLLKNYKLKITNYKKYDYESLGAELFELGAQHLPEVIARYLSGEITPQEQDHDKATYCSMVKKEDGRVDWSKSAEYIERMTRAYMPWPGVFSSYEGTDYKITAAAVADTTTDKTPGTLFVENSQLYAAAGNSSVLHIDTLQPAGKKPMSGADFARGYLA